MTASLREPFAKQGESAGRGEVDSDAQGERLSPSSLTGSKPRRRAMTDAAAESLESYRDVSGSGRAHDPWVRRGVLFVLGLLVLAALLDRFGQHPVTSHAAAPSAALEVQSPDNLRGGLIFQARFTITARERLAKPTLILQPGWLESMSVNSIVPDAAQQDAQDGHLRLTYPPLAAGSSRVVWIYFQVNPTNLGKRSQDVVLADGSRGLAAIHRSVMVWP